MLSVLHAILWISSPVLFMGLMTFLLTRGASWRDHPEWLDNER